MSQTRPNGHIYKCLCYGAIHLNTTTLYSQSRRSILTFFLSLWQNDPIGSTNKTVRQIFQLGQNCYKSRSPCICWWALNCQIRRYTCLISQRNKVCATFSEVLRGVIYGSHTYLHQKLWHPFPIPVHLHLLDHPVGISELA